MIFTITLLLIYMFGCLVGEIYFYVLFDEYFSDKIKCENKFIKKLLEFFFYVLFSVIFILLSWVGFIILFIL